ncbi:MAG: DUF1292 domain-containing protein [Lachnospiraceae bacterium]
MSDPMMNSNEHLNDEDMTVDLELECGTVTCNIITIFDLNDKEYIVLEPEKNPLCEEGDVWIYRYSENPDDPNEEPELEYIEDDEEYEAAVDRFDELLDEQAFDDMEE